MQQTDRKMQHVQQTLRLAMLLSYMVTRIRLDIMDFFYFEGSYSYAVVTIIEGINNDVSM